jgi:hypothetical protein
MESGAVGHNFERDPPRFGLIWFSSFIGKDLNVIFLSKVYDVRQTPSDGKSSKWAPFFALVSL